MLEAAGFTACVSLGRTGYMGTSVTGGELFFARKPGPVAAACTGNKNKV
jgi:hypothetical protein